MLVDPSPKNVTLTSLVPRYFAVNAAPAEIGRCAPTTANDPRTPTEKSVKCIEPPLPLQIPFSLPSNSPNNLSILEPFAITAPWPL